METTCTAARTPFLPFPPFPPFLPFLPFPPLQSLPWQRQNASQAGCGSAFTPPAAQGSSSV